MTFRPSPRGTALFLALCSVGVLGACGDDGAGPDVNRPDVAVLPDATIEEPDAASTDSTDDVESPLDTDDDGVSPPDVAEDDVADTVAPPTDVDTPDESTPSDADTSVEPDTTDPADTSDTADTTDIPATCDGVECGDHGACVADPVVRCECDGGYAPDGLTCVRVWTPARFANLPASVTDDVTREGSFIVLFEDRDNVGPNTLSADATGCGMDVSVSEEGTVSWTCPDRSETCEVTLTVTQDGGHSDEGVLSINCVARAPTFPDNAPRTASEGVAYRWTPNCVDPNGLPITLSRVVGDNCDGGLSNGLYAFTPNESQGGTTCQLMVACSNGELTTTVAAEVAIAEVNVPPVLTSVPASTARWGRAGSATVTASDADRPAQGLSFSVGATTCPFTVSVGADTGVVAYTCDNAVRDCTADVTVSDGQASATGSLAIGCTNATPAASNIRITPETAYRNTPLTCSYSFSDADGDTDGSAIAWFIGASSTPVGTGASLSSGYVAGDVVRCRVTPFDGLAFGPVGQTTVTISNRAPTVSNVRVSPAAPTTQGETLTCMYSFSDPDGDDDASSVEWLVEGTPIATGATFAGHLPGDRVSCRVVADDGFDTGNTGTSSVITAPGPLVIASMGASHACAIEDGALSCWGSNVQRQLGDGTTTSRTTPAIAGGFDNAVTAVATGLQHTCAVVGGVVYCWGGNNRGQAGATASTSVLAPVEVTLPAPADDVIAGAYFSCAIAGGSLYCWGDNTQGQLGDGGVTARHTIGAPIDLDGTVTAATAGNAHVCAIVDGAVSCWGQNSTGQLGFDLGNSREELPVAIASLDTDVTAIAAGLTHTCAIQRGALYCWGSNDSGRLGDGTVLARWSPTAVPGMDDRVTHVAAGAVTCAIRDRALSCWGENTKGELGRGATSTRELSPGLVDGFDTGAARVTVGAWSACAVQDEELFCWGRNNTGQLRRGSEVRALTPNVIDGGPNFSALAIGEAHGCGILSGALYCWGDNTYGRLGIAGILGASVPTPVPGFGSNVTAISAGQNHTCAIRSGAAYCWGRNDYGQLGDGTKTDNATPTVVPGLDSGVTHIAALAASTCAIRGGAVQCWGSNTVGQLGDGTLVEKLSPTAALDLDADVTGLAGGNVHACAIKAGALLCWGLNATGQIGDDTQNNRSRPTAVLTMGASVTAVSAGAQHTCAIRSALWCWGGNGAGQLGDGTAIMKKVPQQVPGHTSLILAVVTGQQHTCANRNKVLSCWGLNDEGQIGDGTTVARTSPVVVDGMNGTTERLQAAGYKSSCSRKGTAIYCWGRNGEAQLGFTGPFSEFPL